MFKKILVCATMLGIVFITLASSGGGKKKSSSANLGIIPISARGNFTVNSRPAYSGSHMMSSVNNRTSVVYRSMVTYQKGNTTYLIPSQYRMNTSSKLSFKNAGLSFRSNLNVIDLKIRLCR